MKRSEDAIEEDLERTSTALRKAQVVVHALACAVEREFVFYSKDKLSARSAGRLRIAVEALHEATMKHSDALSRHTEYEDELISLDIPF